MREKLLMDDNWKFRQGSFEEKRNRWAWGKSGSWNEGPESVAFDDSDWRMVQLPHDYVIEGEPIPYMENEFGSGNNTIPEMQTVKNIHTTAGSFKKEIAFYRKHFFVSKENEGKRIYFIFDGVYRNCHVVLNNFFICKHLSGYTGFICDITDFVNFDEENVLSVRVDPREAEGWFYEGGGIYRHTYLLITDEYHVENIFVAPKVNLEMRTAKLAIQTTLRNETQEELMVEHVIIDPENHVVAKWENKTTGNLLKASIDIESVQLWDLENPNLYQIMTKLFKGSKLVDEYEVYFGIRELRFDANEGFFLNGKPTKIKGVCCHQNHGGLGTALPDELYTYRIGKLKEMGCNAYRTSHYPPTPALLDVCDRMGMLVMDETRLLSSAPEDLEQLSFMVMRDRNHPCVFLYSIGNEEAQSQTTTQGARIAGTMINTIKKLDDTRPITMGLLMWDLANKKPLESIAEIYGIGGKLDVAGFNYHEYRWEEYHMQYPRQPMISTELATFKSTRSCFRTVTDKCHLAITDREEASYMKGASQWHATMQDYMSGAFFWTGFDYYGEPTPYAWPAISSQFGIMDLCGYPKDFYYYYKAWWSEEKVLHIFPDWNGTPREQREIYVFSNCDEIELFVNGTSIGRKTLERDGYLLWEGIYYEPGILIGIGYCDGKPVIKEKLQTTQGEHRVIIDLDFVQNDIYIYKVSILDEKGELVLNDDKDLTFTVDHGTILGTCNGNPTDHVCPKSSRRSTFHGLAQVIVRANKVPRLAYQENR